MSNRLLPLVAPFVLLAFVRVAPAQVQGVAVKPHETVKFDQDKAQAHMQELEERMYRLASMIRDQQPEDAARLLMGVQKAREHLIAEQMGQAAEFLETLKLEQAVGEQGEVIAKLEELKRLLLTANISLEIKLDQLRKIREARKKLGHLVEAEQKQLNQTMRLVERKEANAEPFHDLKPGELRNQRTGEDLAQALKPMGPTTASAAGALSGACQCMGNAAAKLGEAQGSPASDQQHEAIDKLSKADQSLEEVEEKLKKEIEAVARQQVMEYLQEMIARQRQVRDTTARLSTRAAEGNAQSLVAVRKLAGAEEGIINTAIVCLDLCELTEFSVAFPPALGDVIGKMEQVQTDLAAAKADQPVIDLEREVEMDLQSLLQCLQQASRRSLDPQVAEGECLGCKGNLNKLLAEFKMLRHMEQSVHTQTSRLDARFTEQKISDVERIERSAPLSRRQEEVKGALLKIQEEFSGQ